MTSDKEIIEAAEAALAKRTSRIAYPLSADAKADLAAIIAAAEPLITKRAQEAVLRIAVEVSEELAGSVLTAQQGALCVADAICERYGITLEGDANG